MPGRRRSEVRERPSNEAVAALLQEYSDLLAITGGEPFKPRVYEKAARAVAGHSTPVSGLDSDELTKIPGVGASIADKIVEFRDTGRLAVLEELRDRVPAGVRAMTAVPGLGPKKAMLLYQTLGVDSVAGLEEAIDAGRLSGLRGFGPKTAENLRHGIEVSRARSGRFLIDTAMSTAADVVEALARVRVAQRCTYAGSLRRMRESIGDIDVLAAADQPRPLMDALTRLPVVTEVIVHGDKKTSVRTSSGIQVDLRVVPLAAWGAALIYFTGSKPHNLRIREMAGRQGLKLSEYGLFRDEDDSLIVSETEEDVYAQLGMAWIPPTLREDRGEVEAALEGRLPELVTVEDIRGDLHTHTSLTDGVSTLEEMVTAARERGLEYFAVTDHAEKMPMQRMTREKMLKQRAQLRAISGDAMTLLHGTELNIDPDGGVDWDAEFLADFDVCVASVHSHFTQAAAAMTRRLVAACENPYVHIIGHPTTRQIERRPPIEADWDAVFAAAGRTGTVLEVNSYPDRLDLPDELILRAKRYGVKFAVNTDSHARVHLGYLSYGVATAQRGWLTPDDVINTWPLAKLRSFLRGKSGRAPESAARPTRTHARTK
ncbi:MAG TPA: DNA polymerase/3'-5' exonuclease PolX [Micromonosporaceae bacterium]|jgi:DNA polymerase (family 10)